MPPECPHHPPCSLSVTRWVCGQRTNLEDGVKRGFIPREMAERLLKKYGCPITPASKVFTGSAVRREPITESLWRDES